jgi:6,7-dimethyl-8-ribityllumazine synthase
VAGSKKTPKKRVDGSALRVAVVVAQFHEDITARLLEGARDGLRDCRVSKDNVEVQWVPGAFELPLACKRLAESRNFQAIVALGCVIRGETPHFDYVAGESARGIMDAMLATGVPMAFGVLTTDDVAQAQARAGGESNKGYDAAQTAVEMALFVERLRS